MKAVLEKTEIVSKTLIPIDTGRSAPYLLEIAAHEVTMRGLPQSLWGRTFAHLTDFHGGYGNTEPVYEEAIARVNALQPDFIFLTGDYRDDHATNLNFPIADVLRRFKAKEGVFASFGNHDHRRGIAGSRRVLEDACLRILNNASFCHPSGLRIVGVDDLYEGKPDIAAAFEGVPNDRTCIVLSHHPRLIERIPDRDALILSGHTHGGQIALPFPPPAVIVKLHLGCSQVAGWYRNGKARLYVNRGLGVTGKPFRYRCPAEIGIFTMVPSPEDAEPA